jgi:hypothetical protein
VSIIWLNGPFGVGKSTAAHALRKRTPRSVVFNPGIVGWVIRRTIGRIRPGDYTTKWSWRVVTLFIAIAAQLFADPVIIPMSILSPARMSGLLHDLRRFRAVVHHVVLDVSPDVLAERIRVDNAAHPDRQRRDRSPTAYLANREGLIALGAIVDTNGLDSVQIAEAIERAVSRVGPIEP